MRIFVRRIFIIFPHLAELHIAKNNFNKLIITEGFENLEKLHLYNNDIHDFANISALSQLPRLNYLSVRYCRLKNIAFESGFTNLEVLVADGNEFSRWEDISDLKKFPKLKKLTLKCLIPGECGVDTREMLISKLENLIELDHCDISVLERKNAERQFLLRIGMMRPIAQVHYLDFERLSEKHHFSYEEAIIAHEDDDYIWIRFKYLTSWFEKQFPKSMELIRATTLVCRLIGGNPREMDYYIRTNNGVDEPAELRVKPETLLFDLVFGPDNVLLMKDCPKGALHFQTFE
uniref:Tubulin-specific chaperone E n=1 Tax=Panagrolaimus sp. JU765 TaxID=591449 RepID=A0AC34Q2A9_9BILA